MLTGTAVFGRNAELDVGGTAMRVVDFCIGRADANNSWTTIVKLSGIDDPKCLTEAKLSEITRGIDKKNIAVLQSGEVF